MFTIKKISLLTTLMMLAACGGDPTPPTPAAETPKTETTQTAQASEPVGLELLVGTDAAYPPYNFRSESGQSIGFDIDILNAVGAKQNLKFNFIPERPADILPNLDKKKYKLAMATFIRNPEREQKYLISNTYAYGQDVIVSLDATKPTPETMSDLKTLKTIVLGGTAYVEQMETILGKNSPNLLQASNGFLVMKGLATGEAQAAFIDKHVAQHYAKSFPNNQFKLTGKDSADFDKYELVILADKAETELMNKINAGLAQIIQDGTYSQIYQRWFGEAPKDLPPVK